MARLRSSISDFISNVKRRGYSKPNRFEVIFTLPPGLITATNDRFDNSTRLMLSCEQTELPGKLYATTEDVIHGANFKNPYQTIMDDIQMTFRVHDDMLERRIFESWHRLIQNPITNSFNFQENYAVNIEIRQYDHNNNFIYGVTLFRAWPTIITPVSLDQNSENEILRQTVSITYWKWLPLEIRTEDRDLQRDYTISPIENIRDVLDTIIPL